MSSIVMPASGVNLGFCLLTMNLQPDPSFFQFAHAKNLVIRDNIAPTDGTSADFRANAKKLLSITGIGVDKNFFTLSSTVKMRSSGVAAPSFMSSWIAHHLLLYPQAGTHPALRDKVHVLLALKRDAFSAVPKSHFGSSSIRSYHG